MTGSPSPGIASGRDRETERVRGPRFGRWGVVAFLSAAAALNYGDRVAFSAVLPPLRSALHLSDPELGVLGSLFLWSYALGSPFAGHLADRRSRSFVVLASLLGWSLFMGLTGLANGLIALGILRVGLGWSECFFQPAGFALIGDHHGPETRARAMSVLSAAAQFGIMAGGGVAGVLAERLGWRAGFWILGSGGLVLAALASRFIADPPVPPNSAAPRPSARATAAYLCRVPSFYFIMAKSVLTGLPAWMLFGWLPLYLYDRFHMRLGTAGFAGTFILQALLVVGLIAGAWLSDAVGHSRGARRMTLLGIFYLAATPFPLVFLGHPRFAAVAVAMSICALFRGLGEANQEPVICDIVPPEFRATAFGLHNTLATAAGGVGVFMAGMLKGHFGLQAVFAAAAGMYLLNGLALLFAGRFFAPRDIVRAARHTAAA